MCLALIRTHSLLASMHVEQSLNRKGKMKGRRPHAKMAQDAQGQMSAAGGVQHTRQSLRVTAEKFVAWYSEEQTPGRLAVTRRYNGTGVSSARLHALQWYCLYGKGFRKDQAFPILQVRTLQSDAPICMPDVQIFFGSPFFRRLMHKKEIVCYSPL